MVASAGRKLRIAYDADGPGGSAAVVIAGARTDSLTIGNTSIDITDKDDAGIVTLLDDIGTQQITLSVEGVLKDTTLMVLADSAGEGTALHYFDIAISTLRTYSAFFFISDFEMSGEEGDSPMTFTCTLTSSGTVTKV